MTTWLITTDEPSNDITRVGLSGLADYAKTTNANTFELATTFEAPIVLNEVASPPAAGPKSVVFDAVDNGSGKTRLMAQFPTGSSVEIAIEP